jgi:hypothetical protein
LLKQWFLFLLKLNEGIAWATPIFMGGEAAGVDQHDEHLDSWEITSPEGQIS